MMRILRKKKVEICGDLCVLSTTSKGSSYNWCPEDYIFWKGIDKL